MKVLNIGGTGFAGSRITELLVERGHEVVCLDIDPDRSLEDAYDDVTVVQGDITDYEGLESVAETHNPDRAINLAYLLGAESEADPTAALQVNCVGMDNVFRLAAEHDMDRVSYASSLAVYGTPGTFDEEVDEEALAPAAYAQYPVMYYAATKQLNEYQSKLYSDKYDFDAVSIRPSTVFGPGREAGYTSWSSDFVTKPAQGESTYIPHKPDKEFNMVYRDDVATLFTEVTTADEVEHDAYNTGGHRVTASGLADIVDEVIGGEVRCDPDEPGAYPHISKVSHERAAAEFDYELTSLEDAVRDHAATVREEMTAGRQ